MSKRRLSDRIQEVLDANQPPAEHVAGMEGDLVIDPCTIKDWLYRLTPQDPLERLIVEFVREKHSLDDTQFTLWLEARGLTEESYLGVLTIHDYVLSAHSLAMRLCKQYVAAIACPESNIELANKLAALDRLRGSL